MAKIENNKDKEGGKIIGGLILVAIGAALLLKNIGFFLPGWLFSWPVILILVGIFIGFRSNFHNNSWYIISAVGVFFLINDFFPSLSLQPMFWPLVIIGLGIAFILRPHRTYRPDLPSPAGDNGGRYDSDNFSRGTIAAKNIDGSDYLLVRSVFSGINKTIVSKNFQGGHISCVFGGTEIDLSQADINGRVIIKIEMVFGGSKLVVPPHWTVLNQLDGVFHGVDDKRIFNPSATVNPDKVLVLKGSAVFAGLELKSY